MLALASLLVKLSDHTSTEYHTREFLRCLSSPPQVSSWRDRFTRDYAEWVLKGCPTDAQLFDQAGDHERELVSRGAFERREFVLRHRIPSKQTRIEIGALLTRLGSDRKWRCRVHDRAPRFIIVATPTNMKRFDAAIREYDDELRQWTEIK